MLASRIKLYHQTVQICQLSVNQMSFLFDLPAVLQARLVCEWFLLVDVARLDSALCCKKLRPDFLALLCCPQNIIAMHVFQRDTSEVQWVVNKSVKIKSILLFANIVTDDDLCNNVLTSLSGPALECVTLNTHNDNKDYYSRIEKDLSVGVERFLRVLAASCPNLISFRIESEDEYTTINDNLLIDLISNCKKLCFLELYNCRCGSSALLCALYTAPCMESITLTGGLLLENDHTSLTLNHTVTHFNCTHLSILYGNAASAISQICAHFPNLVSLKASEVTNESLVSISKHCPLLQKVAILVQEAIEEESATEAARNWPHLRKLGVHLTMDEDPLSDDEDEDDFEDEFSMWEDALLSFIRHCPRLTYFNTVCRTHSYEQRYREAATNDACDELEGSQLRELYVESLTVGKFYEIHLLCKHLRLLAIHHDYPDRQEYDIFEDMNDRPLEMALQCISKSSVKELYIHNFSGLGGSIGYLEGMHEIHFSNGRPGALKSEDIMSVVTRCPDLRVLKVVNCFRLSHKLLQPLLDLCPALKSLAILNNNRFYYGMDFTDAGRKLKKLVSRRYPQLLEFHVDCKIPVD